jgi:hypothetical protein
MGAACAPKPLLAGAPNMPPPLKPDSDAVAAPKPPAGAPNAAGAPNPLGGDGDATASAAPKPTLAEGAPSVLTPKGNAEAA